jgi:hypothetical protein
VYHYRSRFKSHATDSRVGFWKVEHEPVGVGERRALKLRWVETIISQPAPTDKVYVVRTGACLCSSVLPGKPSLEEEPDLEFVDDIMGHVLKTFSNENFPAGLSDSPQFEPWQSGQGKSRRARQSVASRSWEGRRSRLLQLRPQRPPQWSSTSSKLFDGVLDLDNAMEADIASISEDLLKFAETPAATLESFDFDTEDEDDENVGIFIIEGQEEWYRPSKATLKRQARSRAFQKKPLWAHSGL